MSLRAASLAHKIYSVFTNDLHRTLDNTTMVYADDSILYCAAHTDNHLSELLNRELAKNWIVELEINSC